MPVSPSALRRDGRGGDWFMRDVRVGLGVCWLREEGEEGDRGVNRSEPSESVSESQEGVVVAAGVDTDVGVDIIIVASARDRRSSSWPSMSSGTDSESESEFSALGMTVERD